MSATVETVNTVSDSQPHAEMNHLSLNGNHHTETEMQNLEQILDVSTTVLEQAIDLLENSLASDEQLMVHSKYLPGSTIGAYPTRLRSFIPHSHLKSSLTHAPSNSLTTNPVQNVRKTHIHSPRT